LKSSSIYKREPSIIMIDNRNCLCKSGTCAGGRALEGVQVNDSIIIQAFQTLKSPLFNCTPHFSRVFCTVKKIHNKIHYCKNFIFDRFWTFLDILAKIRKKSENPEFVFSTQWKKCFFYSVEKMFFTLSRKNRLFFNLSRKNRVFYKWDKLKNKLSTLSKCGLQSNKASC